MTFRPARRRGIALIAAVVVAGLPAAAPAAAAEQGTFTASASADGVRISVAIPDFLVISNFVDGGGPTVAAQADSLGGSSGFASFPYPGDTAVTLPGLLGILTGRSLPTYPLYGSSSYPTVPSYELAQPGYRLASTSHSNGTTALAQLGEETTTGTEAGLFATATAGRLPEGDVRASADSRGGLSLATVRIHGFRAHAELLRHRDGTTTRNSDLEFASLSVADVPVSVTDRGLVIGSPGLPAVPVGTPLQSFSHDGTTITYLAATATDESVVSPGLRITTSQQLPRIGHPLNIGYTIGQASASADAGPAGEPARPTTSASGPAGSAAVSGPSSPADTVAGAGLGPRPELVAQVGMAPVQASAGEAPEPRTAVFAPVFSRVVKTLPRLSFYPVFGLFGLFGLIGTAAAARSRRERT